MQKTLAILALIAAPVCFAQSFYDSPETLPIALAGPFAEMLADTGNRAEREFVLTSGEHAIDVKVRVRGKSRVRVCDFPPLRINFSRQDTAGTPFAGMDKQKLVTHCYEDERGAYSIIEEYAAYRIYRLLSDVSYGARLVNATYMEAGGTEGITHVGIIIESDEELAARLDADIVKVPHVTRGEFVAEQAALVYVFQYLIGNTDWSLVAAPDDHCCHNGDLFRTAGGLHYVPYDFDLSGLVNARHARPDPTLRLRRVTQRRYRGYCTSEGAVQAAIETVRAQEAGIMAVIDDLPSLSSRERRQKKDFLARFFKEAEDAEKLARRLESRCL